MVVAGGLPAVGSAKARTPNTVFDLTFSDPNDAGDVGANAAGWLVDRRAPAGWTTAPYDGDDRLEVTIDGTGPTSGFDSYQGKQYRPAGGGSWEAGHNSTLAYRFFVDPDWESDGVGQGTGMWAIVGDASGDVVAYSILEYRDGDATGDGAGFRVFEQTGEWVDLGLPRKTRVDPDAGGWVGVEARLHVEGGTPGLSWHVNGARLVDDTSIDTYGTPAVFQAPILNSRNFGTDQTYYYDDIALTAPGRPGRTG